MKRYNKLDFIRGITIISMIGYHGLWDLIYLHGVSVPWYDAWPGFLWQQSICWTFILLSGFCWPIGKHQLKNGITVFVAGVLVSVVTIIAMPQERILFGVLTMLGSCMLLFIPLEKILKKCKASWGLIGSLLLFTVTYGINNGWIGFMGVKLVEVPQSLYANLFTTYLGFPTKSFYSTDYFSLLPWMFLYATGYFLYRITNQTQKLDTLRGKEGGAVQWMGRHSLILYILHQPLLYVISMGVMFFVERL